MELPQVVLLCVALACCSFCLGWLIGGRDEREAITADLIKTGIARLYGFRIVGHLEQKIAGSTDRWVRTGEEDDDE
jgi:hypothetical protein